LLVSDVPPGIAARPGLATLPAASPGGTPRLVAVNVDPSESDPARLSEEEFLSAVTRSTGAPTADRDSGAAEADTAQNAWRYILLAMIAVLVWESAVSARTV
jgi:hypothetical protein